MCVVENLHKTFTGESDFHFVWSSRVGLLGYARLCAESLKALSPKHITIKILEKISAKNTKDLSEKSM